VSIRRKLLVALLSALFLIGVAASGATWFAVHKEANDVFDYQLQQMALSLRDQTMQSQGDLFPGFDYDFIVQVWDPAGSLVYLSNQSILLPQRGNGFETVPVNGQDWRVFTLSQADKTIQVAAPVSLRRDRAGSMALRILVPIVAAIPLFTLLVFLIVGEGLKPLEEIAAAIRRRAPASLEPLQAAKLPEEVRPMVSALNGLLERLRQAIETQKRFTADAAHELRSPLTALQLQIQLVERARSREGMRDALEQLKAGARRASRLVEQMLTMARLAPEATLQEPAALDLDRLAASVVAEFEPLAEAKAIELRLGRVEPARAIGQEQALHTLAGNLVDNAIRYTPPGGRVVVEIRSEEGGAVLEVKDTGPGIPGEARQRVFDRFYRLPGSGVEGSGLGLAIVKQIAEAHRADITLGETENDRGLKVTVRFPKAPAG
jgi:two-component system, OmpR family, sensor kinase